MLITLKQKTSASDKQPKKATELLAILQESEKALLTRKPVVAHSCMRLAITELTA